MSEVNASLRVQKITRMLTSVPVKAAEVINRNDIVIWDNGNTRAIAGVSVSALKCMGVAAKTVTGGASDGDVTVDVIQGEFVLNNDGTNTITAANVNNGATAYVEGVGTIGNLSTNKTAAGPLIGWHDGKPVVRIEY